MDYDDNGRCVSTDVNQMRASYQSALKGHRNSSPNKKTSTKVTVKVNSNKPTEPQKNLLEAQSTKRLNDDSMRESKTGTGNESASEAKLDLHNRRSTLGRTPSHDEPILIQQDKEVNQDIKKPRFSENPVESRKHSVKRPTPAKDQVAEEDEEDEEIAQVWQIEY